MYFLIDYENVRNLGMRGTEHLLPTDYVIVFYSKSAPVMERVYLEQIKSSGCGFEACKLLTERKNGLDFYIATRVGELFGQKCCQNAVIVSRDTDFRAVRDYWQECSGTKHRVVFSETIEHGIVASGENSPRAKLLRSHRKQVDIGQFYAAYQEDIKLRQALEAAFEGTEYFDRLSEIQVLLRPEASPKIIYLDSLKRFGRKDGQEIYRRLKTCASL